MSNTIEKTEEVKAELRERDEVLLSLDEKRICDWLIRKGDHEAANRLQTDEKRFWASVHCARVLLKSLPREARRLSLKWLLKNGYEQWLVKQGLKTRQ